MSSPNDKQTTQRDFSPAETISRRDFLNGMAVTLAGGVLMHSNAVIALDADPKVTGDLAVASDLTNTLAQSYYPPTRTGMRGSHKGSFEVAHALAWRGETLPGAGS